MKYIKLKVAVFLVIVFVLEITVIIAIVHIIIKNLVK